jgi:hypothetical protein
VTGDESANGGFFVVGTEGQQRSGCGRSTPQAALALTATKQSLHQTAPASTTVCFTK